MKTLVEWFDSGGPVMWVLLGLGVVLYALLFERLGTLFGPGARRRLRETEVAERTERMTGGLALIRALVAAAPLLGLLGTVNGMITTFDGILLGDRVHLVGTGIAQALLTTQFGLVIAVPALLAERILTRRSEQLKHEQDRAGAACRAGERSGRGTP